MADINDLANEVANLTTATTNLVDEVVGQKERLEDLNTQAQVQATLATTKAGEAATSAAAAAVSATEANTAKAGAKSEADRAELAASQATTITGLETVEEAVSQALADGGYTWRTEADMQHERAVNNEMFAASGFVHMGKHYNGNSLNKAINEGLWTTESQVDTSGLALRLGRSPADTIFSGNSKSNLSVINIAGFVTEITDLNENNARCGFKFPESEAGTRVYDSATGVSIDYAKEVDPKYGDIAPDHNEAVARAFEGLVKNGDFRLGTDGSWVASPNHGGEIAISNGEITVTSSGDTSIYSGAENRSTTIERNTPYEITVHVTAFDGSPRYYWYDGGWQYKDLVLGLNKFTVVFSDAAALNISHKLCPHTSVITGKVLTVSSVSIRKVTQEVVTDRVDMFGFEGFLEQITPTNPFVYKHGLIQSQATDIDGIATTVSNRPDSYYAVYDGDTTSRGKGVNFLALSVIEQDKIANNPKNHIYRMKNGDIVQWRVRQRTIAGAGNGDWLEIDSSGTAILKFDSLSTVLAQGIKNTVLEYSSAAGTSYRCTNYGANTIGQTGVFNCGNTLQTSVSYNGECYFYVLGTVPRLNQGAYAPGVNEMGTRQWEGNTGRTGWSGDVDYSTTKDCFILGYGNNAHPATGYISSGLSGRPDGKYYDAIYASGLGGVIDHRLKYGAWDASTSEKAAVVREEVKSGVYRGREKLKFTTPLTPNPSYNFQPMTTTGVWGYSQSNALGTISVPTSAPTGEVITAFSNSYGKNCTHYVLYGDNGETVIVPVLKTRASYEVRAPHSTGTLYIYSVIDVVEELNSKFPTGTTITNIIGLNSEELNITIEGEFTQTDVIGDPANILQCDALKDGWLGSWIPDIPSGVAKEFALTRKSLVSSAINFLWTINNGESWNVVSSKAIDIRSNSITDGITTNGVLILTYTAFAKQTKPSTNLPVLNGENGLSDVFVSQSFNTLYGSLLFESALGQINKHSGYATGSYKLIRCGFEVLSGKPYLKSVWNFPTIPLHSDISLRNQENGGGAGKALFHQSSESEQANLNIIANELIYDSVAGDWGDDSTVKVIASGTFTDSNGKTCKADIHKLAKPYGWIKNDI